MDILKLDVSLAEHQEHVAAAGKHIGEPTLSTPQPSAAVDHCERVVATVRNLRPVDQVRLLLEHISVLDSHNMFQNHLWRFLNNDDAISTDAEFYARAMGYVPALQHPEQSSLALLPADYPSAVRRSAHLITDRVSKGIAIARRRAEAIANRLNVAREMLNVAPESTPTPVDVRRLVFRIRLMQTLRKIDVSAMTLRMLLSHGEPANSTSIDVHKVADHLRAPYQDAKQMDVDTIDDALVLVHPHEGRELAIEFLGTYSTEAAIKRVLHRVTQVDAVRYEAMAQGNERLMRATVSMLLRAIGARDNEPLSERNKKELEDVLGWLGLRFDQAKFNSFWGSLCLSRLQFHQALSLYTLLQRKPRVLTP